MNDSCNASRTSSELIASLTGARDIIQTYGFRIISGAGVIFNYYTLYVLNNHQLKFKFYDFFRCRCFCNLVVCVLSIFMDLEVSALIVSEECTMDYWPLYLKLYLVMIPLRIALRSSAISDILLILNRIALLFDKKESQLYTLSKKVCITKLVLIQLKNN